MKLSNYILTNENSCYYECGYSCDNVLFIKLGDESFFITDARYEIEAKSSARVSKVIITNDLIKASRKIQTKNEIPSAISDDFTTDETKKAIPKNAELIANSNPVYRKNIAHGTSAPLNTPYMIANSIAIKTGKKTVINLPKTLPQ